MSTCPHYVEIITTSTYEQITPPQQIIVPQETDISQYQEPETTQEPTTDSENNDTPLEPSVCQEAGSSYEIALSWGHTFFSYANGIGIENNLCCLFIFV